MRLRERFSQRNKGVLFHSQISRGAFIYAACAIVPSLFRLCGEKGTKSASIWSGPTEAGKTTFLRKADNDPCPPRRAPAQEGDGKLDKFDVKGSSQIPNNADNTSRATRASRAGIASAPALLPALGRMCPSKERLMASRCQNPGNPTCLPRRNASRSRED
jgi:hypothetical protein